MTSFIFSRENVIKCYIIAMIYLPCEYIMIEFNFFLNIHFSDKDQNYIQTIEVYVSIPLRTFYKKFFFSQILYTRPQDLSYVITAM